MMDYDWKGSRLKMFLKKKGIAVKKAAEMLGVQRQTIYQYYKSDALTKKVVIKILTTFSVEEEDIFEARFITDSDSPEIRGNGNISLSKNGDFNNQLVDLKNGNILVVIPLIEEDAYAGFLSRFSDPGFINELPNHSIVVDKFHKGRYFSFRVVEDSMDDGSSGSIVSGAVVTGRDIEKDLWKTRFHIHKFQDYVIVHDEGILVKRIMDHNVDRGIITCASLNLDKNSYPDFELNLNACKMILNVVNVSVNRK